MKPLPVAQVLDQYFLEARAKLLDLAAILDRMDRGGAFEDARAEKLLAGVKLLLNESERAERVQQHFSLPYDPKWPRPVPGSK